MVIEKAKRNQKQTRKKSRRDFWESRGKIRGGIFTIYIY
jgi:hypothetical protein